ncbi:hypothetical protein VPHK46_0052 [Vibrio phage K46]
MMSDINPTLYFVTVLTVYQLDVIYSNCNLNRRLKMATREIYESAKMNIPEGATGMRSWDGFTEFFSGSAKGGWRLICSNTPDVDSIPKSKPVIEIANQEKPKRVEVEWDLLCNANFSVWGLRELLENGELFYSINDEFVSVPVNSCIFAIEHFLSGNIYRKVETEIDERQEFIER